MPLDAALICDKIYESFDDAETKQEGKKCI